MNSNLQQALRSATTALSNFARQPNFWQNFEVAFGQDFDRSKAIAIQQAAIAQNFMLPVELLTDSAMGTATGAYAAATDTIYLRESFVEAGDIAAISAVIVEELGHAIDQRVNKIETLGDEGAIFSLLVNGIKIAKNLLAQLQAENDWGTIIVNGQELVVEMAVITGTEGNDSLTGTRADDLYGLGGNDTLDLGNLLDGGSGNDILSRGSIMKGGSGSDYYYTFGSPSGVVIDDNSGTADGISYLGNARFEKSGSSLKILPGTGSSSFGGDITILNFFSPNGGAGSGAIENFDQGSFGTIGSTRGSFSSARILNQFTPIRTDTNGDRRSDIIWRQGDGSVRLWQMDGTFTGNISIASNSLLAIPVNSSWKINNTGDFNGDSKADILWSNDDGRISLWQMDGSTILATDVLAPDVDWMVTGTGSFSLNDSKTDILWRNADGNVAIWQMDGAKVLSSKVLGKVDSTWKVASTGDFNGDKNSDVLWRKDNGDIAIWLMNGDAVASTVVKGNVTADWKIAGVNDFNNDGNADIIWQNVDGRIAMWLMKGTDVVFADVIGDATGFVVVGTGDYNGDTIGDLLLRDAQGANAIWSTAGGNIFARRAIDSTDPSWQAMPAGLDVLAPSVLAT